MTFEVIASQRVGAKRRPMTGSAKQSSIRHSGMVRKHQARNDELVVSKQPKNALRNLRTVQEN
jgi:hypothetical protein